MLYLRFLILFFIVIAVRSVTAGPPHAVTADQAEAALQRLHEIINQRSALAALREFDPAHPLDEARVYIRDDMSLNELLLLMQRTLAMIGDGHCRIVLADNNARNAKRGVENGRIEHLPFLAKMISEERGSPIVAIRADRTGFVDEDYPFIEAIDGVHIERWLEVIAEFVPRGSPQFVRSRSLRELRSLWRWRLVLGLEAQRDVQVTLSNLDRSDQITKRLRARMGSPSRGDWPRTQTRMIEGNIGYLRLASMRADEDDLESIRQHLEQFRHTSGLIIDVRGNGGGQRHVLHLLGEYLLGPDSTPVVYTAVRPRLVDSRDTLSHRMVRRMQHRHLYPADSDHWSHAQREAIAQFQATFHPQHSARDDQFAQWHYAMLTPGVDERSFHYQSPVIVLMNADCFSATDVFLHAMSQLENITLMGQPSAGSSGAPLSWETGIPGIAVRVASIVSYRSDGSVFDDARGEEPDVRIDPTPDFFIGRTDRVLEAAVERLRD